jgi:5'-nucleotidase/UDP-sugar diphosphatase
VIGNHEFDIGAEKTRRLAELFDFPLLGADIVDEDDHPVFRRKPVILERNGLRIGVMGVSCSGMDEVVTTSRFAVLHMAGQADLVREQIKALDPETDLLVLITHNGVDGDKALARELKGAGLDVIVGGHSHSRLTEPVLEEGVLIVQAGSKMTNLGRLDLEVADDRVVRYDGRLINLWSDGTYADEDLTELITGLENEMLDKYGRTLGEAQVEMRKGRGESNIGNWLSDSFRGYAGADVAFINSGGIRKILPAGPVTALDIHEILPFANSLVVAKLKGAQLAVIAQKNADAAVGGHHGILQVSGLTYSYRKNGETAALDEVKVDGKPLDPGRTYKVAMPDYVVMMQDVYLGLEMPPVEDLGVTLSQVVSEMVEKEGTVTAKVEGRIRLLD